MKLMMISLALFFLSGCAPQTTWVHSSLEASWEIDSELCDAYSMGNAPMPMPGQGLPEYSVSGSGAAGAVPFTFHGTAAPAPHAELRNSVSSFNAALGAAAARTRLYEACLKKLGWKEVEIPE